MQIALRAIEGHQPTAGVDIPLAFYCVMRTAVEARIVSRGGFCARVRIGFVHAAIRIGFLESRSAASSAYFSLISMPTDLIPLSRQATRVVPDPQNGSRT